MDGWLTFVVVGLVSGGGWYLATRFYLEKRAAEKRADENVKERRELEDKEYAARMEIKALRDRINSFVILPSYFYIASYRDDDKMIYNHGVVDANTKEEAQGRVYNTFQQNDRFLRIDIRPIRAKEEEKA